MIEHACKNEGLIMKDLKDEKGNIIAKENERTNCEVWTRVMGYHRPVSYFNIGKQGEHEQRKFFTENEFMKNNDK